MKTLKLALLAGLASTALGSAAHAERPLGLTFNVGAATNYMFRGINQTVNDGQLFGGADITIASIGYAGVWVSTVDFGGGNPTRAEYDFYAGIKPVLGPVTLDVGVLRYGYINKPAGPDQDYTEFKGALSVAAGPLTVGGAVYYSDDNFGETGPATYYEFNAAMPIPNTKFSVSGAVGHQKVRGPSDYTTWNLGAGYAVTDNVGIDVRYHDTDAHSFGKLYQSKFVASVKVLF